MRCRTWMLFGVLASLCCMAGRGFAQTKVAPSLAGVIDIHAHAAPPTGALNFQRQFDAIQAAQIAKIYVQHPNHGGLVMSMAQLKEAARERAMIEVVTSGEGLTGGPPGKGVPAVVDAENPTMDYRPQKIADIRALGPANIILSTDLGQPGRVNCAEAYQMAIAVLLKEGFTQAEIDLMTKTNPARFLGLQ